MAVTDRGIAVNPARQQLPASLRNAGLPVLTIEELARRARELVGTPAPVEYTDQVVGVVTYRDGSVIDVIRQIAE